MDHNVACYRCGASLAELTLPLSRQDECPACRNYLHVCKMCRYFDATVPRRCREDGAEEVIEKERLNFCDWFVASETAFTPQRKQAADQARATLDSLFGDGAPGEAESDDDVSAADDLFK